MTKDLTSYKMACVVARFLDEKIAKDINPPTIEERSERSLRPAKRTGEDTFSMRISILSHKATSFSFYQILCKGKKI